MASRILITGGTGFVGQHLVAALARRGGSDVIVAGSLDGSGEAGAGARVVALDVGDERAVRDAIAREQPTHVVHLAAITAVPAAQDKIREAWDVNFGGTLNVALALTEAAPQCRLLFCSSAEVYGESFCTGAPLDEAAPLEPVTTYGATKAAADIMIAQMARRGLRAIRLRPFNHTGPGQAESFVVSSFAAQIARIERGVQEPVLKVGNLASRRDFLDVRDVVDLYVRAIEGFDALPNGGAINIASGQSFSIDEILKSLLAMSTRQIEVTQDPARLRGTGIDIPDARGNAELAHRMLAWRPQFTLQQTLRSVLEHHRVHAAAS